MNQLAMLERPGRRIACRRRAGARPTLLFLPGYASDMDGTKATTLDDWAAKSKRAMVRFDYGGCGSSEGRFEDETLASWRDDALAVMDEVIEGPVILVGSSMGGWLMLLAALARPERVRGLVGIAAAPDFTDWGYSEEQKRTILDQGRLEEPSPYGAPVVTTRGLWESGEPLCLLGGPVAIDCPVRLLHGQRDEDVPWTHSLALMERIRSDDVQVALVKDGDHRLSRDQDLALLLATVNGLLEGL